MMLGRIEKIITQIISVFCGSDGESGYEKLGDDFLEVRDYDFYFFSATTWGLVGALLLLSRFIIITLKRETFYHRDVCCILRQHSVSRVVEKCPNKAFPRRYI